LVEFKLFTVHRGTRVTGLIRFKGVGVGLRTLDRILLVMVTVMVIVIGDQGFLGAHCERVLGVGSLDSHWEIREEVRDWVGEDKHQGSEGIGFRDG